MIPFKEFEKILEALSQTQANYFKIEKDTEFLEFKRSSHSQPFTPQIPQKQDPQDSEKEPLTWDIPAPYVGFFRRSRQKEGKTLVKLREIIKKDQCVAYIYSNGSYYEVLGERSGKIVEVLVEENQVVEYGQPLFRLKALKTQTEGN